MSAAGAGRGGERSVVLQGGRAKAYRPLPEADRAQALADGLDAYDRGDYFLAHELLEPAWMGTDDLAERDLYQGLIKLAAGYVHAVRGNPVGLTNNLRGARERLGRVPEVEARRRGVALALLLAELDRSLVGAERAAEAERAAAEAERTAAGDGRRPGVVLGRPTTRHPVLGIAAPPVRSR